MFFCVPSCMGTRNLCTVCVRARVRACVGVGVGHCAGVGAYVVGRKDGIAFTTTGINKLPPGANISAANGRHFAKSSAAILTARRSVSCTCDRQATTRDAALFVCAKRSRNP